MPVIPSYLPNDAKERIEVLTGITNAAATIYSSGRFNKESDAVDAAFLLYNEAHARMDEYANQNKGSVRFGF